MRTKKQIIFFAIGIIFFCALGCKNISAQEKSPEEKVKEMLKTFYTNYITMNSGVGYNKSDSIQRLYCTKKLIDYINKLYSEPPGKVDSDVFLKSQMVDIKMLEHLEFGKDPYKDDLYYVYLTYGMWRWTVKLSVVKESEGYKINHVFIPGIDE